MTETVLPTARDWMSTSVLAVGPNDDLFDAINRLLSHHYAAAPVIDEDGNLQGMLTEKDCLRVLSHLTYAGDLEGVVEEYQSAIRAICEPGMDLFRVTELFLSTNFPLLPVVERGRLVGVISRRDALRGIRVFREELFRQQREREQLAGHQADRPRSIENLQRAAASGSRDQLVRLMGRKS
ncbi:MAG: CBS domain-containing protein [Thermoanaerobaculia bacterium]|nr:CBS domain-containing protein [Thermoanaerobaculia bacterium]